MSDSRFFKKADSLTLARIIEITGARLEGEGDLSRLFVDVQGLDKAGEKDVSWMFVSSMKEALLHSKAGACLVSEEFAPFVPKGTVCLVCKDPHRSYGLLSQAFYPVEVNGIVSERAFVDSSAVIGEGTQVDAGAYIGPKVVLGKRCHIYPNAVIMDAVQMGDDCIVGPNATVSHCLAGNKVYIYPGAQVGQDGFGFAMSAQGPVKVVQLGRVIIGNDVEIGANTTVDRGAMGDTVIGNGVRVDNLVQIAHNVKVGDNCVLVSQVGIAGSTELGPFVVLAGQAGLAGHIKIGAGAQIAAQSGILQDVPAGSRLMGTPAVPLKEYFRQVVTLQKLAKQKKKEGE